MQQDYKIKLEQELKILEEIDIEKYILSAYPNKIIGEIIISRFSAEDFIFYVNKIISNFKLRFSENNDWKFLGTTCVLPNNNNILIGNAVRTLTSAIKVRNFNDAEPYLWGIVNYQLINGFWNEKKSYSPKQVNLNKIYSDLEIRKKEYDENLRLLIAENQKLKEKLEERENQLSEIEETKSSLEKLLSDANDIFKKYEDVDEDIKSQKQENTDNLKSIENKLTEAENFKNQIFSDLKDIRAHKGAIEENATYIKLKADEVTDLAGRTADNALAFSFSKRKNELAWGVWFWRFIGIPSSFILGIAWIYFSYKCFEIPVENEFLKLLFFSGKLSLSLLLIIFAFREYMKERKLLEDYSFKTAVAFTVNSYADQIAMRRNIDESDGEYYELLKAKEKARQEFIEKTVKDLYVSPSYSVDASVKNITLNPAELIKLKDKESLTSTTSPSNK